MNEQLASRKGKFTVDLKIIQSWFRGNYEICPICGGKKHAEHWMCLGCFINAETSEKGLGAKLTAEVKDQFIFIKSQSAKVVKPLVNVAKMDAFAMAYLLKTPDCSQGQLVKLLVTEFGTAAVESVAVRAIRKYEKQQEVVRLISEQYEEKRRLFFAPYLELVRSYSDEQLKGNSHGLAKQIQLEHADENLNFKVLIAAVITIREERRQAAAALEQYLPFHEHTPNLLKVSVKNPGSARKKSKTKKAVQVVTPPKEGGGKKQKNRSK